MPKPTFTRPIVEIPGDPPTYAGSSAADVAELNRVISELYGTANPQDRERAEDAADRATGQADIATTQAGNAAVSAAQADQFATQAELAALAAGAPIVTTLTDPVPANGTVELLKLDAGLQVHEVVTGAWVLRGWLAADLNSVKIYGAIGGGAATDVDRLAIADAANTRQVIVIPPGTYNLNGGTLTMPAGRTVSFEGGVLTNGTIACNGTYFQGVRGLSETITLTGTVANETGVFFEWFTCEKATSAVYDTFINGTEATYGAAPSISAVNRTILSMLITQRHRTQFGEGIYPFDDAVILNNARPFNLEGVERARTLLWAPNSPFLHCTQFGAQYCSFDKLTVESDGAVLLTDRGQVQAFHGIEARRCNFKSYSDHCFHNDRTVTGPFSNPMYDTLFHRCGVHAAADKAMFYEWDSGSNIYDDVVETFRFFNRVATNHKGIPKAMFWNSNAKVYKNSNITYSGMDYVFYADRSGLWRWTACDNVFEAAFDGNSFQAIARAETGSGNVHINFRDNLYILDTGLETGYPFVLLAANVFVYNFDGPKPIFSNGVRNLSDNYVQSVTGLLDSGGTKYRLRYYEPHSRDSLGNDGASVTRAATQNLADMVGMGDIYAADSENISAVEIRRSLRAINGSSVVAGSGTTANRPTSRIFQGFVFFDSTLGKPIWYDGSGWVDATGSSV